MLQHIWAMLVAHAWQLLGFGTIFLLVEFLAPARRQQPKWRSGSRLDLTLSFVGPMLVQPFYLITATVLTFWIFAPGPPQARQPAARTVAIRGGRTDTPLQHFTPASPEIALAATLRRTLHRASSLVSQAYLAARAAIYSQNLWLQFALALPLVDFVGYWRHRFMHSKFLWPFHAIHHSSKTLDWLSNERNHPSINTSSPL